MTRRHAVFLAAAGSALAAATVFMRLTPDAFPFGDAAIIQIYTLEVLRSFLTLGPYSQFGWHHPGPLYFYGLVPLYEIAGRRAIGLVAGALAINVASLMGIDRLVRRNAGPFAAAAIVARRSLTTIASSFWWRISLCIAVVVWAPTLYEQVTGAPGNLTRIWQYLFAAPHTGQPLRAAFITWSDMTTAVVRKGLAVGWGAAYQPQASVPMQIGAVVQLAGMTAALITFRRTGQAFMAWLCVFVLLVSLLAGWSITRIADDVGDYEVFWISVLGALMWGAMVTAVIPAARRPGLRKSAGVVVLVILVMAIRALADARAYAVEQRETDVRRKIVSLAVADYLEREGIRRPMFHIAQATWLDAACVVLDAYKQHPSVAVDPPWVHIFGDALAPTGREDADVYIEDRTGDTVPLTRGGDRLVVSADGLFVHAFRR
ncbi:MAG TPA: hypothetical protein VHU82_12910 [Vicinamibacterales bacterium]|nr:hypothetical protein [Vicinamibacterales bacterium]